MIKAVLVLTILGGALGALLGLADMKLKVELDSRVQGVLERLPGVNCGGCGYPGCPGFAEGLISGEVKRISACVIASTIAKENIRDYLATSPDSDGNVLKVNI